MAENHGDDEQAVRRALAGDDAAWYTLVENYRTYIYRITWRVTLNEDDAMDAVQETFMKAATGLHSLGQPAAFRSWITTIALREATSICRRKNASPQPIDEELLADLIDRQVQTRGANEDAQGAAEAIDHERRLAQVHAAMHELAPQQRAILILGITRDIGPAEAARELGLPANQVRSQWSRAVAHLRKILCNDNDAEARRK